MLIFRQEWRRCRGPRPEHIIEFRAPHSDRQRIVSFFAAETMMNAHNENLSFAGRPMNRRDFLRVAAIGTAATCVDPAFGQNGSAGAWRRFEVTTHVEVLKPAGETRVWVPAALIVREPFQRTLKNTFQCEGGEAKAIDDRRQGLGIIAAKFPAGRAESGLPIALVKSLRQKLVVIRAAPDERTLRNWKSLHYEKLVGDRVGERSIRINKQWRLVFTLDSECKPPRMTILGVEDYH
ncbi:MAG TPA: type II toxin-antitoxin system RelE/ParE family toxin [Bryobacteraceae bacterium]|nr:type II toxin-antitoxin system RelE/ParE family toxin [Bryobacteraceae bacterium]